MELKEQRQHGAAEEPARAKRCASADENLTAASSAAVKRAEPRGNRLKNAILHSLCGFYNKFMQKNNKKRYIIFKNPKIRETRINTVFLRVFQCLKIGVMGHSTLKSPKIVENHIIGDFFRFRP